MEWSLLFLQIMLINIVLSGDNAVVIAMASRHLPLHQRRQAVWWGAFGAVMLRILLTIFVVYLLRIPWIQVLGAALLLWIAIKLLVAEEKDHSQVKEVLTLRGAIATIIIADFVMSLDNVLAIAAKAEGNPTIIAVGIALSIPIIVWGSNLVMRLIAKYPLVIYLGAGILGYTAGEMFIKDEAVALYFESDVPHWLIPPLAAAIVVGAGLIKKALPSAQQ